MRRDRQVLGYGTMIRKIKCAGCVVRIQYSGDNYPTFCEYVWGSDNAKQKWDALDDNR